MGGCFEIRLTFVGLQNFGPYFAYFRKEKYNHSETPCISWYDISRPRHEETVTTKDNNLRGCSLFGNRNW